MLEHIIRYPENRRYDTPLFLQHGSWHGAWCWHNFLDYFPTLGYEVHAISLPGHGNSPLDRQHMNQYHFHDYVDYMAGEIDKVSSTPIVVGHSMGGAIVQKYMETHSLPGAVLLASIPVSGTANFARRLLRRIPGPMLRSVFFLDGKALIQTPEMAAANFLSADNKLDKQWFHQHLTPESAWVGLELARPPFKSEKVQSPVLVLSGSQDALFSVKEEALTAQRLHAEFHVFDGQAHNLMQEPKWQQVADTIHEWIQRL